MAKCLFNFISSTGYVPRRRPKGRVPLLPFGNPIGFVPAASDGELRLKPLRGRGALSLPDNRFSELQREDADDGWFKEESLTSVATHVTADSARSIINYNESPDVPFDRSINPYRGCEHGCVYCFARPTHAYLGLSPGLDFETHLSYKANAAELLEQELGKKNYYCQPITLGINTDAYQPLERKLKITRQLLHVLKKSSHPVMIVSKSSLIERDIDVLASMAQRKLVHVAISVTTLDHHLSRKLEPRAASPQRRLQSIRRLREAGIPVMVLIAPVIPVLTECELENIMSEVKEAGAMDVAYVLLRLPHETKELFEQWLLEHVPLKADHVLNRMRELRGGKLYDAQFGKRMVGEGVYAELLAQRFQLMKKKLTFVGMPGLDTSQFVPPVKQGAQMSLF